MTSIQPSCFAPFTEITAAVSTRLGGISPPPLGMNLSLFVGDDPESVRRNRALFFGGLGMEDTELAFAGQIHSALVKRVEGGGTYGDCDALITNVSRTFLCISIADCVPILMFDPASKVVAAVHAGWRGTAAGIIGVAVRRMVEEYDTVPATVIAYIGPAAGVCCYEVGEEVARQFDPGFIRREKERTFLDLKSDNARQMTRAGIHPDHIEISPYCTISDGHIFHSYRRDSEKSGRMMAVIGMKGNPSTYRI